MISILIGTAVAAASPAAPCLGQPYQACVASLRRVFTIDENDLSRQLEGMNKVDVNGRPLPGRKLIILSVSYPGQSVPHVSTLDLDGEMHVKSMDISLPGDPGDANTAEEYEQTHMAEAMSAILPAACSADKLSLYKFFQNQVKPKIVHDGRDAHVGDTNASVNYFSHTPSIPYCGGHLKYTRLLGQDTDNITEDNPHGMGSIVSLDFEP